MSGNPYIVSLVIAIWGFHQAKEEMGRVMEKARETEGPWYVKLNTAMAYDQAAGLWENIKRIFYRAVLGPVSLLMSVGGAFAGAFGRQHGGPVLGGMPYLVGERGPELFVPNTAGRIVPNNEVNNNQVTVNFHGNINNTSNTSLDDIGARISRQIQLAQQGI